MVEPRRLSADEELRVKALRSCFRGVAVVVERVVPHGEQQRRALQMIRDAEEAAVAGYLAGIAPER